MKYKRIVVTKRGPPENLQIAECDLRDPSANEVRVKVLAACVCLPDVQARYGLSPFAPKVPFVPGHAIVGVVDAAGPGVTQVAPGAKVAAYLVVGGYAEYVYLRENQVVPVPPSLNPAEAVTLVLNYVTAYQALHRSAKVKAGDKVLIIGASGGCGTAFLELGRLANLTMYGIVSTLRGIRFLALQPKAVPGGLGLPLSAAPGGQDPAGHQRRIPASRSSAGQCTPRKRSSRWESRPGGAGTAGGE